MESIKGDIWDNMCNLRGNIKEDIYSYIHYKPKYVIRENTLDIIENNIVINIEVEIRAYVQGNCFNLHKQNIKINI